MRPKDGSHGADQAPSVLDLMLCASFGAGAAVAKPGCIMILHEGQGSCRCGSSLDSRPQSRELNTSQNRVMPMGHATQHEPCTDPRHQKGPLPRADRHGSLRGRPGRERSPWGLATRGRRIHVVRKDHGHAVSDVGSLAMPRKDIPVESFARPGSDFPSLQCLHRFFPVWS